MDRDVDRSSAAYKAGAALRWRKPGSIPEAIVMAATRIGLFIFLAVVFYSLSQPYPVCMITGISDAWGCAVYAGGGPDRN